jgi:hypothetical protein
MKAPKMPEPTTQRLSFALSNPTSKEDGSYEILAITSGFGNGWKFSPATLQKSLSLWDGVHCFLDHSLSARSIKDIAGILTNPVFDEDAHGIRATLKPFGPRAELLTSLAPTLISAQPPNGTTGQTDYKVGFSADLSFVGSTLKGAGKNSVNEIVKIHSVDLVVNPDYVCPSDFPTGGIIGSVGTGGQATGGCLTANRGVCNVASGRKNRRNRPLLGMLLCCQNCLMLNNSSIKLCTRKIKNKSICHK